MDFGGEAVSQSAGLETVRALRQTIVALRQALERSRSEITQLKSQPWPVDSSSVQEVIKVLSIENHVLRQQIIARDDDAPPPKPKKIVTIKSPEKRKERPLDRIETKISIEARNLSRSLESLTVVQSPANRKISFTKTVSFSDLATMTDDDATKNRYEEADRLLLSPETDLDQEVDDIELIFTTDETKEQDFKEELVPIDGRESSTSNLLNLDQDRELDDDVFDEDDDDDGRRQMKRDNSMFNSRSDNSINRDKSLKSYCSLQDSSFENRSLEKDESFDRFDESVRIVETDISKCGIQEVEYVGTRRNTCPNPIQYRPLSHRDVLSKLNYKKSRPILTHSNAIRRESEAQTDISALPGSAWRSESSLGNKPKCGDNFTTLPCKYPLQGGSRLRVSDKTVEARRVLLSDIGFTSMVPELSRSADHLCPAALKPPLQVTSYGQFLKATDLYSPGCLSQNKFTWTATTATPSDCSRTASRYSSVYPLSPPAPSRRCSAPVSPSRRATMKHASSKVRFANGSLPELRSNWTTIDSGDSTDSLVDEAETYLRRSIDCVVIGKNHHAYGDSRRTPSHRRASAPDSEGDNVPPHGWQPFLPRMPRDLKQENWVKVITVEGRVRGGRVRYVGPVGTQNREPFVGVQLSFPEGSSDGTHEGRRYFQCEPYHAIFVPFKKVIMGWRP